LTVRAAERLAAARALAAWRRIVLQAAALGSERDRLLA
jgi:hypothetical protein